MLLGGGVFTTLGELEIRNGAIIVAGVLFALMLGGLLALMLGGLLVLMLGGLLVLMLDFVVPIYELVT